MLKPTNIKCTKYVSYSRTIKTVNKKNNQDFPAGAVWQMCPAPAVAPMMNGAISGLNYLHVVHLFHSFPQDRSLSKLTRFTVFHNSCLENPHLHFKSCNVFCWDYVNEGRNTANLPRHGCSHTRSHPQIPAGGHKPTHRRWIPLVLAVFLPKIPR